MKISPNLAPPVEILFDYDLKIENEIRKSVGIFEKFVIRNLEI